MGLFYERLESDNVAKELLEKAEKAPYTYGCFGSFQYKYDGTLNGGELYIGMYLVKEVEKLIDEINENFKNIKVEIIHSKFIKDHVGYEMYSPEYIFYIFKVVLNEGYSQKANQVLVMSIAEFIRGYCPYYDFFKEIIKNKKNFIDGVLNGQGAHGGAWMSSTKYGYYKCERDVFNKLDDIESVNNVCKSHDLEIMPYTSELMYRLKTNTSPRSNW